MIRDQWYVILESKEVTGVPRRFMRMNEYLVLWRDSSGNAHCLIDRCCHRGAALSDGRIAGDNIRCPFHGLEFSGDGKCQFIPANGREAEVPENFRVSSYPLYEAFGWIWIWWGRKLGDVPKKNHHDGVSELSHHGIVSKPAGLPEYFDDLGEGFKHSTVQDHWDAHYSRVLENQLDVVHVPIVHHRTIGRGNRTVVDGPGVEWINNRLMYTYVFNRHDDGTPPLKPHQVPVPPQREYKLELLMPNLWQNYISSRMRIVAAFVPVDNERTILYLRFYQNFMKIPVITALMHRMFDRFNLIVAHEDRRVVQKQVPKASVLQGGEQLLQGDMPIVEYRKKREQLMKDFDQVMAPEPVA